MQELSRRIAENTLSFIIHGQDSTKVALTPTNYNHAIFITHVYTRVLQPKISLLHTFGLKDLSDL